MLHPDTLVRFIDDEKGSGVFARFRIPKGTIVWVMDALDRVFTEDEVGLFPPVIREVLEKYCFRNDRAHWVFPWDNTRYVNHSFDANCLGTQLGFEIAVRDIAEGEELTNDYGSLNIIEPTDFPPDPRSARRQAMPDDLLGHADQWDRAIADAFPHLCRVAQPLERLFDPARWRSLMEMSRSGRSPESLREYYCGARV